MFPLKRIFRQTLMTLICTLVASAQVTSRPGLGRQRLSAAYDALPLLFEPNLGQSDPQVKFLSHRNGFTVFLTPGGMVLSTAEHASARLTFLGANPAPRIEGQDKLLSTSNYFLGKDSARWRGRVPNYASVRYENIYPGVDLVY